MIFLPTAIHLEMTQKGYLVGPSTFHIIINDLGDSTWNMLIHSGGDTKLRSTENAQESRTKTQNCSDKMHFMSKKEKNFKKKKAIPTRS